MNISGTRVVLVILDGYGISPEEENNAVFLANTPNLDRLFSRYPNTQLEASGTAVGLPPGQIGNSEVGHMTMGCGSVLEQDLLRINRALDNRSFFDNFVLAEAIDKAKRKSRPVHLLGLVSDGGVHSHIRHLEALLELCRSQGVSPLLHFFSDGRDTPTRKAIEFAKQISEPLRAANGECATLMGRFYAMDRDKRWDRTNKAWDAITLNQGRQAGSLEEAIQSSYAAGEGDEFIQPMVLPAAVPLQDGDSLIVFNFRSDRPRQLVSALLPQSFDGFHRKRKPAVKIATMTELSKVLHCPVAFQPFLPLTTLAKTVSAAGLKQFHCAETEKYPHVTFFFNGGDEKPLHGEERELIPSPRVDTYDKCPEMSAPEVAQTLIKAMARDDLSFAVVNFANADMVGHSASPTPTIQAVEALDKQVGDIYLAAKRYGWTLVITSDHGNCDEMIDLETGEPNTCHTDNPVPCLIVNDPGHSRQAHALELADGCAISSIAPTVLDLMGINIPTEMKAPSLVLNPKVLRKRRK